LTAEEMEIPQAEVPAEEKKIITHEAPLKKEAQKLFEKVN
jgi:hypothetical protein